MAGFQAPNNKDSMDINELAALNDEISPELIEQLQQKLSQDTKTLNDSASNVDESDDVNLFEEFPASVSTPVQEVKEESEIKQELGTKSEVVESENEKEPMQEEEKALEQPQIEKKGEQLKEQESSQNAESSKEVPQLDKSIDDNFIKKYKAKLDKQRAAFTNEFSAESSVTEEKNEGSDETQDINNLTNGTITEKTITKAQKEYNDSLDFLDGNVKYSKYVIYIDPQNVDFIEGLTVKERKNLINKIIREQDDISITKQRFRVVQAVIRHVIVAIITVAVSVPVIYYAVNASLEASIDNYRRSQSNFQILYREKGKINIKQSVQK